MKRFLSIFALLTLMSLFFNTSLNAQSVSINVNIGNQPAWGPVGYDYARYYYFPDIDVYYDVNNSLFYYWDRGSWRGNRYLPYRYNQYDLYRMYKVVINQPTPWRYHDRYRSKYAHYRGNHTQIVIFNSPDRRYDPYRGNRVDWINPNYGNRPNQNVSKPHPGNGNNRPNAGMPNQPNNNRPGGNQSNNNRPNGNQSNNNRPNGNQQNNNRPGNNQPGANNGSKPNDKFAGNGVGRPAESNTNQHPNSSAGKNSSRSSESRTKVGGRSNQKDNQESGPATTSSRSHSGGR